jgi:hypothetical protein
MPAPNNLTNFVLQPTPSMSAPDAIKSPAPAPKAGIPSLNEIMKLPGVIGCASCNVNGTTDESFGDEAEVLSNVLIYFQQMADLIGESCGLESLTEAHLMGQSLTAVCLPRGDNTLGVLFGPKAKPAQVIPLIVSE